MKEVSKLTKIYTGFFGEDAPEQIIKERREECSNCPFNSKNANELSLLDGIRANLTSPFCTLCGCQIYEKTSSPLEECAMYMIDKPKKWSKIKIETMEKEALNLIKIPGNKDYEISLKEGNFIFTLGEVKAGEDVSLEALFQGKEDNKVEFQTMKVACGCTSSKSETLDDRTIKSSFKINIGKTNMGANSKTATIYYKINGKPKSDTLKFKFFRTA